MTATLMANPISRIKSSERQLAARPGHPRAID